MLEEVFATKKEIFISSKIDPNKTKFKKMKNIQWLYCIPKYPCKIEEFDFKNMKKFDGFSNHCPHIAAPITAAFSGARIIEIHITSSKIKNFIDNPVSFDYNELKQMVSIIREIEKTNR